LNAGHRRSVCQLARDYSPRKPNRKPRHRNSNKKNAQAQRQKKVKGEPRALNRTFPHRPPPNKNIVDHAISKKHDPAAAQTKKLREPNRKLRQRSTNKKTMQASQTPNNGVVEHTSPTKHFLHRRSNKKLREELNRKLRQRSSNKKLRKPNVEQNI
jgi:hypothetical protein